jgi:hypothetical protein
MREDGNYSRLKDTFFILSFKLHWPRQSVAAWPSAFQQSHYLFPFLSFPRSKPLEKLCGSLTSNTSYSTIHILSER